MNILLITMALGMQLQAPAIGDGSDWSLVYRGEAHVTYVHRPSINRAPDRLIVWTRADYVTARPSGAMRSFYEQEVYCARRVLVLTGYVNHDAGGRVIGSHQFPVTDRRDHVVQPDSQGSALLGLVCE